MTEQLQRLLDQYPVFEHSEKQKLRCTLTGHEIPSRFDQLDQYVKTSKFVRAWRIHQIMKEYGEYFDDIGLREYGCKITMKIIAKDPDALLRHINGKIFKKGLKKGLNCSCTDAANAPLADAFEVDDFLLNDVQQCCNLQVTGITNASLTGKNEVSGSSENEEEMEEDDVLTEVINDDSFSEDEGELSKEDEYPELTGTSGESIVESESYDFTVMDTEKDMNGANRKRKADNSTTFKKKRVK